MQNSQLQRLLNVMRKTNDKTIVLDNETEQMFVLMNLDSYEDMLDRDDFVNPLGGSDDDDDMDEYLLDDTLHEAEKSQENQTSALDISNIFSSTGESEEAKKVELTKNVNLAKSSEDLTSNWAINNRATPVLSEENLTDVPHEEEEEKFYLEPVE